MAPTTKRWLWRAVKTAIVLAIFAGVGWTLYENMQRLDAESLTWEPAWLALAGLSYLLGLLPCAILWRWSLLALDQRPRTFAALRAYYVSHLGKYVPGKALVPIIRMVMIRGPGVNASAAVTTVFYETLTVMAAGVILGAISISEFAAISEWTLVLVFVLLVGAILLAPHVFNLLVGWMAKRFRAIPVGPVRPLPFVLFLGGLGLGAVSWLGLGLSLWATMRAVHDVPLELPQLVQCTAFVALATVAGFATPAPGGLGVREWILLQLLTPSLGAAAAGIVAILLRVIWIIAELAAAGVLYPAGLVFSKQDGPR